MRGLLDDLDPAALAGVVSCFTYEHRSKTAAPPPWFPSAEVRRRVGRHRAARPAAQRRRGQGSGCPVTRLPDPTFLAAGHAWAAGESLDDVLDDEDLSGGDFVRNVKQLIDLLRQIAEVAPLAGHRSGRGRGRRAPVPRRRRRVVGGRRRRRRPRRRSPSAATSRRSRDDREGRAVGRARAAARRRRGRALRRRGPSGGRGGPAGGRAGPAARAARRRPVPHGRRPGRRGPAPGPDAMRLPVDLGVGAHRRPPALVRRPPRGPRGRGGGAGVRGDERRVARPVGRRAAAHPDDGLLDTCPADRRSTTASRPAAGFRQAPTCRTPAIVERRVHSIQRDFARPLDIWLDGETRRPGAHAVAPGRARRAHLRRVTTPPRTRRNRERKR